MFYGGNEEEIENENENEENYNENEEREMLEVNDLEERYNGEEDRHIKMTDIPERLQLRYRNRREPYENELVEESQWIYFYMENLFHQEQKDQLKPKIIEKIRVCLENIRINHYEVMYLYFYKMNEFVPLINLQ